MSKNHTVSGMVKGRNEIDLRFLASIPKPTDVRVPL